METGAEAEAGAVPGSGGGGRTKWFDYEGATPATQPGSDPTETAATDASSGANVLASSEASGDASGGVSGGMSGGMSGNAGGGDEVAVPRGRQHWQTLRATSSSPPPSHNLAVP